MSKQISETIVITGGTGFLGQYLAQYFKKLGYQIIIFSRSKRADEESIKYVQWDGKMQGNKNILYPLEGKIGWKQYLEGATAVINLAGRSVHCRYTEENKRLVLKSRIDSTHAIGRAINNCINPPKVWLNGGSATIYKHSLEKDNDEITGDLGSGFSVDVCQKWEKAFFSWSRKGTRKVFMRISIILGKGGGAMGPILNLVKFGLGGKQGSGNQYISWLHVEDFARMVEWLIDHEEFDGVVNCVSPKPIRNGEFMAKLRGIYGVSIGVPLPKFLLEIGAFIIRTQTELILKSRKVVPTRFQEVGFEFKYPVLEDAFLEIVGE